MSKIIVDANVWIRYARAKDIAPLLKRFTTYDFLPVVNNYLLSEIFNALVENNWMRKKSAHNIIGFIKKISLVVIEKAVFGISPDPKDNYLFDVAIQNECVFMITDDSELLDFFLKPLPIYTSTWFLEMLPVI